MNALRYVLAAIALAFVPAAHAQALAGSERVEFAVRGAGGEEKIFGYLFLPAERAADARLPAVVLVHGSGGVRDIREGFWGRELSAAGYAVLAIDSFTPRGVKSTVDDQTRVSAVQMTRDAFAAAAFLSRHPAVDAKRIAVMGMSKGGSVALESADEREIRAAGGAPFAAHVPLYPSCAIQYRKPRMHAPILMLIGTKDDYTGVKSCAEYAERIRAAGGSVALKTYEGATHDFDAGIAARRDLWIGEAQNFRDCVILLEDSGGATVGFYPDARRQALADIKAFLSIHLTPRSKT